MPEVTRFAEAMDAIQRLKADQGVNLDGKMYTRVVDRIETFRRHFGDEYGIDTNVLLPDPFEHGATVVANCKITDQQGRIVASGWAGEIVGSSEFTRYSPIEVAETSAIGRALAAFGLHGGEYASAQEIEAAGNRKKRDNAPTNSRPEERDPNPQQRERLGLYVPSDHDTMWLQPDVELKKVLGDLERVVSIADLGRYWDELRPFMEVLQKDHQVGFAELKAAFATAHSVLGEK